MLWHLRPWFWEDCFPQGYLVPKDSKQLLLLTHQPTQSVHISPSLFSNAHTSSQYSSCTNSPQGQVPPRARPNYSNWPILSLLRTPTLPHPLLSSKIPRKPLAHALLFPLSTSWLTLVLPLMALHCMCCLLFPGTCEYRPILKKKMSFPFLFLFVTIWDDGC